MISPWFLLLLNAMVWWKHSSLRHVQCAAVALLAVGACWTGQWKVSDMKRDEMDVTRAPFLTEGDNGEGGGTAWGPWLVAFAVRLCRLRNQQGGEHVACAARYE